MWSFVSWPALIPVLEFIPALPSIPSLLEPRGCSQGWAGAAGGWRCVPAALLGLWLHMGSSSMSQAQPPNPGGSEGLWDTLKAPNPPQFGVICSWFLGHYKRELFMGKVLLQAPHPRNSSVQESSQISQTGHSEHKSAPGEGAALWDNLGESGTCPCPWQGMEWDELSNPFPWA